MKLTYVIRFLLAIAFGVLFGQYVQRDYEKWHAQGRDAFLSYQGHRFDTYMAHPGVGAFHIVVATILVVGMVALYEMAAFILERFWLSMGRGTTSTTPNS
jgi:beta-lactamase class A